MERSNEGGMEMRIEEKRKQGGIHLHHVVMLQK